MDPIGRTVLVGSPSRDFGVTVAHASPAPAVAPVDSPRAVTAGAEAALEGAVNRDRKSRAPGGGPPEADHVDETDGAAAASGPRPTRFRSQFSYEADLGRTVISIVDAETEETITSIPSKEVLRSLRDAIRLAHRCQGDESKVCTSA
jgi:hypothetical protein